MFARSVGDANEIYYDEDYAKKTEPGAIIAPPTFVQASAQFEPDSPAPENRTGVVRFGQGPDRHHQARRQRRWRRRWRWWSPRRTTLRLSPYAQSR
ncbi:MAG: MaoC family dehydratase N-terminal domain-containing protein [Gammaproteobacteria bacterium]|nr:MaoC family dehydratase N-terminal domain-containing protein [Gammaproteobacteria bacterium]